MGEISTIGLDVAKSVFHVHGVGDDGTGVVRGRESRGRHNQTVRFRQQP
jgi:transposase